MKKTIWGVLLAFALVVFVINAVGSLHQYAGSHTTSMLAYSDSGCPPPDPPAPRPAPKPDSNGDGNIIPGS